MSRLLPHTPPANPRPPEARVCRLCESGADVIDALRTDTARAIIDALHEEPMTPSQLAERLETSIQTVSYHLQKLGDVRLVSVTETWYSVKGQEMNVYAPTTSEIILEFGDDRRQR